jgi:cytoskeletal protein RodZ
VNHNEPAYQSVRNSLACQFEGTEEYISRQEPTVESIGQIIKTRRAERGLTLAEAHEATKITMQNLAAIEEDRFDAFPNRVYARAFLRDYANYLGLDSADLLQRYEAEWGAPVPEPVRRRKSKAVGVTIGIIALAGLLAGGAYLYSKYMPRPAPIVKPSESEMTKPAPAPVAPKPVEAVNPTPVTTAAPVTPTDSATKPAPLQKPAVAPDKVVVSMRAARGASWITVTVDGKQEASRLLPAGETASFQGSRNITVVLGNAGAIDVTANGKAYGAIGRSGAVIKKAFTRPTAPATP